MAIGNQYHYHPGEQQFNPGNLVPVKLHPKGGGQGQGQQSPYAPDEVRIGPPPQGQGQAGEQPPKQPGQQKQPSQPKQPGQQKPKPAKTWKVGDRVTSKTDKQKKGTIIDIRGEGNNQTATVDWDDAPLSEALQPNIPVSDLATDSGGDSGDDGDGDEGDGDEGESDSGGESDGEGSGAGEEEGQGGGEEGDPFEGEGEGEGGSPQHNPGGVERTQAAEGEDGSSLPKVEVQSPNRESEWKDAPSSEKIEPLNPKDKQRMRSKPLNVDDIREIIEADTIKQGSGRSSGGSSILTNMLVKAYSTKTDWRAILRKFLRRGEPTKDITRSLKRPSRMGTALGRYLPSAQKIPTGMPHRTVVVAIDTSGSVFDPKFMDKFFSEVFNIVRTQNMDVFMIMWADTAYYSVKITKQTVDKEMKKVKLVTGGTNMSSVARLLLEPENARMLRTISGIVYITDLEVESNPVLVKNVPIAIFGPASLMPKYAIEQWRSKGVPIATYDDSNESVW